jgi:AcrR family transcriptional regulator
VSAERGLTTRGKARHGTRLPAPERREAILAAALRVFCSGSYTGTTTAEIAREAGVSEPVIYRHFASKRALWLACMDEAWARFHVAHEKKLAALGQERGIDAFGPALDEMRRARVLLASLWIQGVTEASEDAEIQRHVRRHMRAAHDFVADGMRQGQSCGRIPGDRDPDAEAWIMIAGALLTAVADRLGGVLTREDFEAIRVQRFRWLLGDDAEAAIRTAP